MSTSPLTHYDHTDPTTALRISQKAPTILSKSSLQPASLPWSLIGAAESPEEWAELEQTFYACLRAEDDDSAHKCLERLSIRFGSSNDKVVAMWGLFKEATAKDPDDLRKVLQEYNTMLEEKPMNVPVHKRRIALIRSMEKPQEAISSLVQFLETFPTDTEAWCELSDLYQSQGLITQAIFCLEEALLTVPNAWNLQAKLGELNYLASLIAQDDAAKHLSEAVHRFARSIELCDDYLRGYYGLKVATDSIVKTGKAGKWEYDLSVEKIRALNTLATSKLRSIVQQWAQKQLVDSNESEIIAAQALLDQI